mgnify:CR=1 FL=1
MGGPGHCSLHTSYPRTSRRPLPKQGHSPTLCAQSLPVLSQIDIEPQQTSILECNALVDDDEVVMGPKGMDVWAAEKGSLKGLKREWAGRSAQARTSRQVATVKEGKVTEGGRPEMGRWMKGDA